MDLLKFDLEIAKREPERVRHATGLVPDFCIPLPDGSCAIRWPNCDIATTVYPPFGNLRLAPKTRKVKVRVFSQSYHRSGYVAICIGDSGFDDSDWIGEGEIEVRGER